MTSAIIKRIFQMFQARIFLVLWISLITFFFYDTFTFYKNGRQFYYIRQILGLGLCISRGSATVINLCSALVLLPLCKKLSQLLYRVLSRVSPGLFFFWLERTKSFHMTVAITLFICGVIHSISHFVNLWNFSRKYDEIRPEINLASHKNENPLVLLLSQPGLTGISMLLITTTMCIMSLRIVRRKVYNAFWYTHQLYLPFLLLLIIHPLSGVLKEEVLDHNESQDSSSHVDNNSSVNSHQFVSVKSTTWLWMIIPLTCFFIDFMWRICARNRASVDIVKVNLMAGRILGLTLSCPHEDFQCRPGQYVLLQCLDISLLEWHPFTVVKVPTNSERDFVVWIKVTGDWTDALENLLIEKSNNNVRMLVDGPMASPMERVGRCRVALCVATGVGVTPFVPMLYQLLSDPRSESPGRVHLLWIVRSEQEAAVLADLATRCLHELRSCNRPDRLDIQIHITGKSNTHDAANQTMVNEKGVTYIVNNENLGLLTPNTPANTLEKANSDSNNDQYSLAKVYPVLGCRMRRGRPSWDQVFGNWVHLYPREQLTLFCCGSKKLVKTLRNKSKRVSVNTKTKIMFVHERFS